MDKKIKWTTSIRKGIIRIGIGLFITLFMFTLFSQKIHASATWGFNYTGAAQTWTVPYTGRYKFEVWGASGGDGVARSGGKGGYSYGELSITAGENIYVYVGGAGIASGYSQHGIITGGFNGGASIYNQSPSWSTGSGGGATDIRRSDANLTNRIVVAGGGGGGTYRNDALYGGTGGYGGGDSGGNGGFIDGGYQGGYGGGQTSGGSARSNNSGSSYSGIAGTFGVGGEATYIPINGGAGGGWYGGGSAYCSGQGGGSGYVGGVQNGQTIRGDQKFPAPSGGFETGHAGHGYARITALNNQPAISLTTPTANQTFSPTVYMPLTGIVNDSDAGQILKVYYRIDGSAGQAGTQVGSDITANGANQSYSCNINVGSLSEGNHTLYTWVVDNQNVSSAETSTTFTVKKTAPGSGGLSVNSGVQYAKSSPVTLTTTASGATKMFISLGNNTTPTSTTGVTSGVTTGWIPYSGTYNWNYTGADGNITFYAWYSDAVWNISSSYSDGITFDKTIPTGGSIMINKKPDGTGATYANTSPLKVTLNAADAISPSVVKMFISTSSTAPTPTSTATTGVSTGWINYASAYDWPYTGVDGTVKLNVWYMDAATNITPMYYDDITFDKTSAAGTITINAPSGGIYTHTATTQQEFAVGTAQGTKATSAGNLELDNATSGTYISQVLDISGVATAGGSLIGWTEYLPSGTDVKIDTSLTFNRGATWTDWTKANKDEAIPGITVGMDLRTVWLKYRITLTSTTLGVTPQFNDITVNVVSPGSGSADKAEVVLSFTKVYSYANVNQVILSNSSDFQLSQTFDYGDTINWTLDNSSKGAKTVFAKYTDWAGNTSNYFTSSTVVDNSPPTGSISINGGAASTNQPTVTLTIGASDDTTAQSEIQMMISNREDFTGGVWESFAQTKSWPIDSSTSGTKTVYVKFKDKLGNISEPVSASISYTAQTSGGSGGSTILNSYITYSFLTSVQQYQKITLTDGTTVFLTGPNAPTISLSDSQYNDLTSRSIFLDQGRVYYRLEFDVTDANADKIEGMDIIIDFNDLNIEGITFNMEPITVELKKENNGIFEVLKYINAEPIGRNRYRIGVGRDTADNPMIKVNKGGRYAIDYSARVLTKKTDDTVSNEIKGVINRATIKIFTGAGGYTEFIEPNRDGKQFNIITNVSRWNEGVH